MERLTFEGSYCDIAQCTAIPCRYSNNCTQKQVWERLKAYEDTGLTPECIAIQHNHVHCKDCKWFMRDPGSSGPICILSSSVRYKIKENDFCSFGKMEANVHQTSEN